jgi:Zn ribbon nucleic-acid-binding protein
MTVTDFMFGPMSVRVALPCPKCRRDPTIVVYRYLGAVAVRCVGCGYQWSEHWADRPQLRELFKDELPRSSD